MNNDSEEYDKRLNTLGAQLSQDNEFLENEFNTERLLNVSPYEILNNYYKLTIEELKRQIEMLQEQTGKEEGSERKILKMDAGKIKENELEEELAKALENNEILVKNIYKVRKGKTWSL